MANPLQTIVRALARDAGPAPTPARARDAGTSFLGTSSLFRNYALLGGLRNKLSGLGGSGDKAVSSYFIPTRLLNRYLIETFYNESWVCAKLVDIPVDDMFLRPRQWVGEDEDAIRRVEDFEDSLGVYEALGNAMKAGRMYGTGLVVMVTNVGMMSDELVPEQVRPGDLKSLLVFDRFDCSVEQYDQDPTSTNFGKPAMYKIQSRLLDNAMDVHPSRILRFDGKKSINSDGWSGAYDRQWGVSEIIAAITEIQHDSTFTNAIAHLSQEASIPVVKVNNFREALMGRQGPDAPTVDELGNLFNQHKSTYRTVFMDKNDEFDRVAVSFAGYAEVMDRLAIRVAAMAGIPATRFLSRSPVGMNATGESDMKNYAVHVAAMRSRLLRVPFKRLDMIVAKSLGMDEPLDYEWPSLIDLSDEEIANISKVKAEAFSLLLDRNVVFENEARERLSGDPLFGELEQLPEDQFPDETEEAIELEKVKAAVGQQQNEPPESD